VIDGHDLGEITGALREAAALQGKPGMIIAKTKKGKGVSFIEDRNGWHGKALKKDELARALAELGAVDTALQGIIPTPQDLRPAAAPPAEAKPSPYLNGRPAAPRQAYGMALDRLASAFPEIVVLDGEVSNSTFAEIFQQGHPDRFFEMYVAEQNMVGTALGLSLRGKAPFVSTFAAFLTRAYDQVRMARYSNGNIKFCGSHAGVSIGEDGSSQMGLEDLAMFRAILDSVVLYPADAVSTGKLVEEMARHRGISYLRTTRMELPLLYGQHEAFPIGGSKVLRSGSADIAAVAAAGITVHEALKAYEMLKQEDIFIRVIDLYSIKPVDRQTLRQAADDTGIIITVEDHFAEGGIADAVREALSERPVPVHALAVRRMPRSGRPGELLEYEGISAESIAAAVKRAAG
jgi:transketolase